MNVLCGSLSLGKSPQLVLCGGGGASKSGIKNYIVGMTKLNDI